MSTVRARACWIIVALESIPNPPTQSHQLGEILHIIARIATNIQQRRSLLHLQEIKHTLPVNAC